MIFLSNFRSISEILMVICIFCYSRKQEFWMYQEEGGGGGGYFIIYLKGYLGSHQTNIKYLPLKLGKQY